LWEIALKAERRALELPTTIESYLDRLRRARGLSVIELDGTVAVAAARLEWEHREPPAALRDSRASSPRPERAEFTER
jgi:PIN domain nuclease of toxin-antitoxin system